MLVTLYLDVHIPFPHSLPLPPSPSPPLPCRPKRGALFALDLQIDEDGVHYSSDLAGFERMLVNVFDRGIQVCQKVPRLERVREEGGEKVVVGRGGRGRREGREWKANMMRGRLKAVIRDWYLMLQK